jgi:hypothetical protein
MVEIFYGPDGVGKDTVIADRLAYNPDTLVLHGTNFLQWFEDSRQAELLAAVDIFPKDIPPADQFLARSELLTYAVLCLTDRDVVVNGACLHKTAMNAKAGRIALAGLDPNAPMKDIVYGPLGQYFTDLNDGSVTHTQVRLEPGINDAEAGKMLQDRIWHRGEPSIWDPRTPEESTHQWQASSALEACLTENGFLVAQAISRL